MAVYSVIAPLSVPKTKTKKFILNLNYYRNTHYQTLNKTKINYKQLMEAQIRTLPKFDRIKIVYVLYVKTRRQTDISNVLSIHDKYFCDALVEFGKLEDDSYTFLPEVTYTFGGHDKDHPRVQIIITTI